MGKTKWTYTVVILLLVAAPYHAIYLESIYWNSSNTKFHPGKGLMLYPQIGDKMDIVCPRVEALSGDKEEFYRVYLVTRSQMERCSIDKTDTPLLNCDKPHRDVKFTFKFQEFSPNLWGLEFLKGRDYYITSTSIGTLQGLDNTNGGVCRSKSMKLLLRVGQSSSDPPSIPQESPTRFPPKQSKPGDKDTFSKGNEVTATSEKTADTASEDSPSGGGGGPSSDPGLFIGVVCGCLALIMVVMVVLVLIWKYQRRHCAPGGQPLASMSLSTLAVPKRDSISSEHNASDPDDIVFPLRASESMFCRHYERVSGDYGAPVYIVQEIAPQSPTNIYYKV
ncbi:ephrin-B2a-like [Aplochiton taeniatus]